jgi:hypothetical protein
MQLLEEQGRTATAVGRAAIAVLLFQDLMVAPVLFGVEMLGRNGGNVAFGLAVAVLQAAVAIATIDCRLRSAPSWQGCCCRKQSTATRSRSTLRRSRDFWSGSSSSRSA